MATTDTSHEPELHRDIDALLDYATRLRPDIDPEDLRGAILAADAANWPWRRTVKAVAQIVADGETPYDLRNATHTPWQGGPRTHR